MNQQRSSSRVSMPAPVAWFARGFQRVERTFPKVRLAMWKGFYNYMARKFPIENWTLMNYGYAPVEGDPKMGLELEPEDEINRWAIQLYHHITQDVDLEDKIVVEVGCGRGGGASFLTRYKKPTNYTGLDLSNKAIDFCRKMHGQVPNLSFVQGNALELPWDDNSVDVVVNCESAHHYPSQDTFLKEVHRVLKPGGHLCFTDYRESTEAYDRIGEMSASLTNSPLTVIHKYDIAAEVVHALDLDEERKQALVDQAGVSTKSLLWPVAQQLAATKGSAMYEDFVHGDLGYLTFVLRKD